MKKVLFIDSHSTTGHINFNKIYLREIEKNDVEIHTILRKNYFDLSPFLKTKLLFSIPNFMYFDKNLGNFLNRITLCFQLLYVRFNVNFKNYDFVILSHYDEMALFFSGIKSKMYLVNHDNARGFDSSIKTFFLKKISKNHAHIVFTEETKQRFIQQEILDVHLIPHGLIIEDKSDIIDHALILSNIDNRIISKEFNYILFSPSGLTDINELENVIKNEGFINYIHKKKILVVIKSQSEAGKDRNILTINKYLSAEEYKALFDISNAILICYPKSFKYRVSGVLFECFATNKRCFIYQIPPFLVFKSYFNYDPYFKSANELIDKIEDMINSKETECYNSLDSLQPKFEFLNN